MSTAVPHYDKLGGMTQFGRAFLTPKEKWFLQRNMRTVDGRLEQIPLKKVRQYTIPYSGRTLLDLTNIPSKAGSVLVGVTEDRVKRITATNATNLKKDGVVLELNRAERYLRYGKCVYNNRLFFVNEVNPVYYTDGSSVTAVGGNCPKGRYVEVWFDHLVVGGPIFPGEDAYDCVAWSHLDEWGNFTPDTDSEADRYVFTDYQRDSDVVPGVTGLRKLGNACVVYTASTIYQMQYTGLPRVVRVNPVVQDFGCGLKYSLASIGGRHFFIDTVVKDFIEFNGQGVSLIGADIKKLFFALLTNDLDLQQRTWSYADIEHKEVWWVFVSKESDGRFDSAVVYNYQQKTWFLASVEDVHSFAFTGEETAQTVDQLAGTCDSLPGTCDRLGAATVKNIRLWGGRNEVVMKEEAVEDSTTDLLRQAKPILETGDEAFSSVQLEKETSSVAVQGSMTGQEVLDVELCAKNNLDEEEMFKRVGLWNPAKRPALTFQKVVGRTFRWRFSPLERPSTQRLVYKNGVSDFSFRVEMEGLTNVVPELPPDAEPPEPPETTFELSIASTPLAVEVTVIPNDVNGDGSGTTPFSRTYGAGRGVQLTAPALNGSGFRFYRWKVGAVTVSADRTIQVVASTAFTITAEYIDPETGMPTPPTVPPPFEPPTDLFGFTVSFLLRNNDTSCASVVTGVTVNEAETLNGFSSLKGEMFEKLGVTLGSVATDSVGEYARVWIDAQFLTLDESEPDMLETATTVSFDVYSPDEFGVCQKTSSYTRSMAYADVLSHLRAIGGTAEGSDTDPYEIVIGPS